MIEQILIGVALLAGLALGWHFGRMRSRKLVAEGQQNAAKVLEKARQQAALIIREVEAQGREESQQLRQAAEALQRQSAEENVLLEEVLTKREARLEARERAIAERAEALAARQSACEASREEARQLKQQAKEQRLAYSQGVAECAGETAEQIKEQLVEGLVEETRAQCADRLRNLEATSAEEFMRQSKRVMGIAIGRYGGKLLNERLTSSLTLSTTQAGRLWTSPETLATIEELTAVHLVRSESGENVRFESGDSVARELARRVVSRVVAEEQVRDLPRLINSVIAELEREISEMGKKAFNMMGLPPAHPEIVTLLGRLNFRTSYTQNQWQHAIESASLAGLMAAELGLDVQLARRCTLIHDIGKALTHEIDGSHAVIGADYARRLGEEELVANAIGAHHGDESPASPYAYLVAAADAMSGARPGARREMVETYVDHISELERITSQFSGVVHVHAVQAGRELRVHVDEAKISDSRAGELSEAIAEKISAELTFPGQIRVMVIREFKAVEFAS